MLLLRFCQVTQLSKNCLYFSSDVVNVGVTWSSYRPSQVGCTVPAVMRPTRYHRMGVLNSTKNSNVHWMTLNLCCGQLVLGGRYLWYEIITDCFNIHDLAEVMGSDTTGLVMMEHSSFIMSFIQQGENIFEQHSWKGMIVCRIPLILEIGRYSECQESNLQSVYLGFGLTKD